MLVKKQILNAKDRKISNCVMEVQIEKLLDKFADDVIKVLANQTIPLK